MYFFGIGAMILVGISWTIYGYVMGKAPKENIRISCLMILSAFLAGLVSLVIGMVQGFPQTDNRFLLLALGSQFACGIINYVQLDLMSRAMQKGPNGIIWSIMQSGFIFPFFMGVIFFSVPLTPMRLAGVTSMLIALALFGGGPNHGQYGKWKLLTFGAFLCTGGAQSLCNLPSYYPEAEVVSSVWRTMAFSFGMSAGGLLFELPRKMDFVRDMADHLRRGRVWITCAILEIPELFSSFCLIYPGMDILSKLGIGSIAYPLMVGSCIIFFELFSIIILREKRRWPQWAALALCLAGAACISL